MGTEFIRHVINELMRVLPALLKAQAVPRCTMAWVLQELGLHQQPDRRGVHQATLNCPERDVPAGGSPVTCASPQNGASKA